LNIGHDAMELKRRGLIAEAAKLSRLAQKQKPSQALSARSRALPHLWLMTDPDRLPDPVGTALRLPKGSGIVYRGFGRPQALVEALALADLAKRRGLTLLIGADEALAYRVGADGVHLPERMMGNAKRFRARHPNWIITTAAHSPRAIAKAARLGLDGALVSPVFVSQSPSASRPLGQTRVAEWAHRANLPVIALGGIGHKNARLLSGTGVWGIAAIDGLRT
jgi:thiamine-phosphate pyrophosphorylase